MSFPDQWARLAGGATSAVLDALTGLINHLLSAAGLQYRFSDLGSALAAGVGLLALTWALLHLLFDD